MNDIRTNHFDLMRLFAAGLVLVTHSYVLLGLSDPLGVVTHGQIDFGKLGVDIFFIMSGYLIAISQERSGFWSFLGKRVVRIFPGLGAALIFSVFILGPLCTELPIVTYFSAERTWRYLGNMMLVRTVYDLPGVFTHNPFTGIINGSLWTLAYEFLMYLGVASLIPFSALNKKYVLGILYGFLFMSWLFFHDFISIYAIPHAGMGFSFLVPLMLYFGAGFLIYKFGVLEKVTTGMVATLIICYLITLWMGWGSYSSIICLPIIVLYLAVQQKGWGVHAGKYGDFSYGIYIYSFPLQQTIIMALGADMPVYIHILMSLSITLPMAFFSWWFIEKPCLHLKRYM